MNVARCLIVLIFLELSLQVLTKSEGQDNAKNTKKKSTKHRKHSLHSDTSSRYGLKMLKTKLQQHQPVEAQYDSGINDASASNEGLDFWPQPKYFYDLTEDLEHQRKQKERLQSHSSSNDASIQKSIGTVGNEFVFSFPPNYYYNTDYFPQVSLTTSSLHLVDVNVTVMDGNVYYRQVSRYQGALVQLPYTAFLSKGTGIQTSTIVIRSSNGISVQGMSDGIGKVADGFLAIPIQGLGTRYFIPSYISLPGYSQKSQFAISALDEGTMINITTKQGNKHHVYLEPYQTYLYQSYDDLTGSLVVSDKPVAVMGGNECSYVPSTTQACDHLIEQIPPVDNLGYNFALSPFPGRTSGYRYRVIGTHSGTTNVTLSNSVLFNVFLQEGEFYEGNVNGNLITTMKSDQKVVVVQYMKGGSPDGTTGDPSMLLNQPLETFASNVTFQLFSFPSHYVSVTLECKFLSALTFDEHYSMADWDILTSDDGVICVSRGAIGYGHHSVGHPDPEAKFYVSLSGLQSYESYAYPVGFNFVAAPKPPPSTTVECKDGMMTVDIPRTLIGDVAGDHLYLLDESCVGADHNVTHVRVETAFNQCGTIMEVRDDYVVFSNVVQDEAVPITPGKVITRDREIQIPVECRMEKDGLGSISFHPDSSKIIYSEEGYGKFSFQLQLYQDSSYTTPFPPEAYPIDVNLRDELYFEADVTAEEGLELFVETCVATPTANPYSTPQYHFIENGCSKDNTLQFVPSGDPMIQRFTLEAFAFVDIEPPVYVHCFLMLCNTSDTTSRCSLGCQPIITKRDVSMRRDPHGGSKAYVMSQGPLTFLKDELRTYEENEDTLRSSEHLYQWAFLMIAIGTVTLSITVIAVKARNRHPRSI